MRIQQILLSISFIIISQVSQADSNAANNNTADNSTGWYIGPLAGQIKLSVSSEHYSTYSSTPLSYGLYWGKHITSWFGLESTYVKTEKFDDTTSGIYDSHAEIFTFMPKVSIPITNKLSLYAKYGMTQIKYKEHRNPGGSSRNTWKSSDESYGIGTEIRLSSHIRARLGYEYYKNTLSNGGYFNWSMYGSRYRYFKAKSYFIGLNYQL